MNLILKIIKGYKKIISPGMTHVFGPSLGCRFYPTCSHYLAESIKKKGIFLGGIRGAYRLLRCTPLSPGGVDLP